MYDLKYCFSNSFLIFQPIISKRFLLKICIYLTFIHLRFLGTGFFWYSLYIFLTIFSLKLIMRVLYQ